MCSMIKSLPGEYYSPEQISGRLKLALGVEISNETIYKHIWGDKKSRIRDWEIDTVIGKNHKQALVTIVERKSKFTVMKKVETKTAELVAAATIELLRPYKDLVFSITADRAKSLPITRR